MRSFVRYLRRENEETRRQIERIPERERWAGDLVAVLIVAAIVAGCIYWI